MFSMEHALIIIVVVLEAIIPDVPDDVLETDISRIQSREVGEKAVEDYKNSRDEFADFDDL